MILWLRVDAEEALCIKQANGYGRLVVLTFYFWLSINFASSAFRNS
jgi:hypothetical protein